MSTAIELKAKYRERAGAPTNASKSRTGCKRCVMRPGRTRFIARMKHAQSMGMAKSLRRGL